MANDGSLYLFLEPAPGMLVRDPELRDFLPTAGRRVNPSLYWTRRLIDKDVIEIKAAPAVAKES